MAKVTTSNPLIDTSTSDTNAEIALHPLVLLTISDYITRRTLRQQSGPIVGAIIGQQDGRQLTLEVAFECKTMQTGGQILLDKMWFENRLEQYRTVFKAPQLDLVGWFTIGSEAGPEPRHIPLHHQIQSQYSLENAILLLFHPEQVAQSSQSGGKLPLTLYEGVRASSEDAGANAMEIDGASGSALKFRELAYAVETGEAEMISLDFVARGGGNAAAVQTTQTKSQPAAAESSKGKGKAKVVDGPVDTAESPKNYLSAEDEECKYPCTLPLRINRPTNPIYRSHIGPSQDQRHQDAPISYRSTPVILIKSPTFILDRRKLPSLNGSKQSTKPSGSTLNLFLAGSPASAYPIRHRSVQPRGQTNQV